MKFKTNKNSETGKKFAALKIKLDESLEATKKIIDEIGAEKWRTGFFQVKSGISAIYFPDGYEIPKHFKKVEDDGGYMPDTRFKEGKSVLRKIHLLPVIDPWEVNQCLYIEEEFSVVVHIKFLHEDYFLFDVSEKWFSKSNPIPYDCEEITTKEYNELVNQIKA